jgi:hypothetical protein
MKNLLLRSFLHCAFLLSIIGTVPAAHAAGDAASFNPIPVSVQASVIGGGVPVGAVVAWPVALNPTDAEFWLECNGQSTAGYPELTAVVGANVPDLRGKFIRGLGGSSAGLGVAQADAGRNITGSFMADNTQRYEMPGYAGHAPNGAFAQAQDVQGFDLVNYPSASPLGGWINLDASRSWGASHTASEFRPINMAVRYLIRARP